MEHACNTRAAAQVGRVWCAVRGARIRTHQMPRGGTQQFLSPRRNLPVTRDVNGELISTELGARLGRFVKATRTKRVTFMAGTALLGMLVARHDRANADGPAKQQNPYGVVVPAASEADAMTETLEAQREK